MVIVSSSVKTSFAAMGWITIMTDLRGISINTAVSKCMKWFHSFFILHFSPFYLLFSTESVFLQEEKAPQRTSGRTWFVQVVWLYLRRFRCFLFHQNMAMARKIPKEVQAIFDKYIQQKTAKRLKKADAIHMLEVYFFQACYPGCLTRRSATSVSKGASLKMTHFKSADTCCHAAMRVCPGPGVSAWTST